MVGKGELHIWRSVDRIGADGELRAGRDWWKPANGSAALINYAPASSDKDYCMLLVKAFSAINTQINSIQVTMRTGAVANLNDFFQNISLKSIDLMLDSH